MTNHPFKFMYSANTLLRRYTPPTCTLEIAAKGSPLSRWFGRPLLEKLQFSLNFDDPRLPEHKRATIRGDKTQLDALCEVVQIYVQNFLDQSPDQLNASFLAPTLTDRSPSPDIDTELPNGWTDPSITSEIRQFHRAESEETQPPPSHSSESNSPATESQNSLLSATHPETNSNPTPLQIDQGIGIYLQQNGLLSHDFFLGSLATEESGPVIHLSLLQLFDLATALDEYSSDLQTLPTVNRPVALKTLPPWAKIAAAVLVTVGLSAVGFQIIDRKTTNQTATTAINPETTPTEQPPIAAVPAPLETPGVPSPPVSSSQTLLPPPPTTGTPSPGATPPANPGVLPSLSGTSPGGSTLSPTPGTSPPAGSTPTPGASPPPNQPPTSPTPAGTELYKLPGNAGSGPSRTTNQTASPNSANNPRANVQILPSQTNSRPQPQKQPVAQPRGAVVPQPPPLTPPAPAPSPPPLVAPPAPQPGDPLPGEQVALKPSPPQQSPARPTSKPNHSPVPNAPVNPSFSDVYQQQGTDNSASRSRATAPISASGAEKTPEIATMPRQITPTAEQLPVAGSAVTPPPSPNPLSSAERNSGTLFDTIPQVGEARKYFQNRWQPPNSLTQRLEYSLALNADGSIRQIIPLGQVAETYLDRTEMPLIGESFVSPVDGKRTPKIRIVLNPDGKVDTFLESLD